jgi:hypothetical protein
MNPIEVYDRCLSGKPYSKELKIYSKRYLKRVVEKLAEIDEFEKCIELNKFIENRFNLPVLLEFIFHDILSKLN